ncbi:YybH family protein [Xanthomonas dyei]|uniref:DUF4440 domain-containing protein n=1 Tax=Xanthomonas dyei TaxID=743699 RepID=A0A2S7C7U3_9XANT|nr:nuclear transport factor 2 family protein [Xanthomonas dyei]PPU57646.1 DUF4440 domain-containing protein [Xanthomonas dyei]
MHADIERITQAILAVDNGINARWNEGDVDGALEAYSDEVSYFDPLTALRLDGHAAVEAYFRNVFEGKLKILRNDYIQPVVMVSDNRDMAVLHYNLQNILGDGQGGETPGTAWNSTQVFRYIEGRWRVVHVHWSITLHPGAQQSLMS